MSLIESLVAVQTSTKRDVQALGVALADRTDDGLVRAVFREDRYGVFAYAGLPTKVSDGSRLLAARAIDSGTGKPATPLRSLELIAALDADDSAEGDEIDATALEHGDLASARLEHPLYGAFDVAGVALQTPDGTRTLIGEWIVADAGAAAPAVVAVHRLAAAGTHDVAVPGELAHVESDVV